MDFAGPFPQDAVTGYQYVIIAVEWVTRWAEAEVVANAPASMAAEFIYFMINVCYGCVDSFQSNN